MIHPLSLCGRRGAWTEEKQLLLRQVPPTTQPAAFPVAQTPGVLSGSLRHPRSPRLPAGEARLARGSQLEAPAGCPRLLLASGCPRAQHRDAIAKDPRQDFRVGLHCLGQSDSPLSGQGPRVLLSTLLIPGVTPRGCGDRPWGSRPGRPAISNSPEFGPRTQSSGFVSWEPASPAFLPLVSLSQSHSSGQPLSLTHPPSS